MSTEPILTNLNPAGRASPAWHKRLRYLVPVAVFMALAFALGWALTHNPREIPSALVGKPGE